MYNKNPVMNNIIRIIPSLTLSNKDNCNRPVTERINNTSITITIMMDTVNPT